MSICDGEMLILWLVASLCPSPLPCDCYVLIDQQSCLSKKCLFTGSSAGPGMTIREYDAFNVCAEYVRQDEKNTKSLYSAKCEKKLVKDDVS